LNQDMRGLYSRPLRGRGKTAANASMNCSRRSPARCYAGRNDWPMRGTILSSARLPEVSTDLEDQMNESTKRVSDLLHEAGETHHQVFRITDGADDDWAS
jgi:hypothetical protein